VGKLRGGQAGALDLGQRVALGPQFAGARPAVDQAANLGGGGARLVAVSAVHGVRGFLARRLIAQLRERLRVVAQLMHAVGRVAELREPLGVQALLQQPGRPLARAADDHRVRLGRVGSPQQAQSLRSWISPGPAAQSEWRSHAYTLALASRAFASKPPRQCLARHRHARPSSIVKRRCMIKPFDDSTNQKHRLDCFLDAPGEAHERFFIDRARQAGSLG
jgi:hypothetical protein